MISLTKEVFADGIEEQLEKYADFHAESYWAENKSKLLAFYQEKINEFAVSTRINIPEIVSMVTPELNDHLKNIVNGEQIREQINQQLYTTLEKESQEYMHTTLPEMLEGAVITEIYKLSLAKLKRKSEMVLEERLNSFPKGNTFPDDDPNFFKISEQELSVIADELKLTFSPEFDNSDQGDFSHKMREKISEHIIGWKLHGLAANIERKML